MAEQDVDTRDLQKCSAEMIVLALLEARALHGYELAKLMESRSGSKLQFHVTSLYPTLYRLERKGLLEGRWLEKVGKRRRRLCRQPLGRKVESQRRTWRKFMTTLDTLTGSFMPDFVAHVWSRYVFIHNGTSTSLENRRRDGAGAC